MKTLIFLILLSVNVFSQGLGFTTDLSVLVGPVESPIAPGFSVLTNVEILPDLLLEARGGITPLGTEYKGWHVALYSIYNVKKPFHLIAGINYHSNDGAAGSEIKNIILMGLGGGIDITSFMTFDVTYNFPLKREEWSAYLDKNTQIVYLSYLKGVVRADLRFHWQL